MSFGGIKFLECIQFLLGGHFWLDMHDVDDEDVLLTILSMSEQTDGGSKTYNSLLFVNHFALKARPWTNCV